ncbi:MAG: class I SAM-dependent methyltransferase [Acidobacteriota bacterium]
MNRSPSFDAQAAAFDRRAGLPAGSQRRIAQAIQQAAGRLPLVELGAGTGSLGSRLVGALAPYVGCDLSLAMLASFRRRSRAPLVLADGEAPWPFAASTVGTVFASRSLHLMRRRALVPEILRVLGPRPGCALLVGRVVRSQGSPIARLRRRMHGSLRHLGLEPRAPKAHLAAVLKQCCDSGARVIEPSVAAAWTSRGTAAEALAAWRSKNGLAGRAITPEQQRQVLAEVETWAAAEWPSLEAEMEWQTEYILQGAAWP